jgi:hypothetical protein
LKIDGAPMLQPKARRSRRYWENLTDEELLETELMTDDPESLENLVYALPAGDDEPYVEFKYDLRKTEREMLRCVHGNHRHLAGFVFRKGAERFLVGWICGGSIYGEDFDKYTADFDAAVNRQDALKRVREIRGAIDPFASWLAEVSQSQVFKHYLRLRGQLREGMPWIYDHLPAAAALNVRVIGASLPANLCNESSDAREDFNKILNEMSVASLALVGEAELVAKKIGLIRSRMEGLVRRVEAVIELLREVETFFQPTVLAALCKLANENDNPRKRTYESGLLTITCKRDRQNTTISMPKDFALPSKRPIENFRSALSGMVA